MKKKSSILKKSVASKPAAMKMNYNGKSWEASSLTEGQLEKLLAEIESQAPAHKIPRSIYPNYLRERADDGSARITIVVAETLTYTKAGKPARYKMESGRMAAQAAHVASKLRMLYILEHSTSTDGQARNLVRMLHNTPITTITLKGRDSEELRHIAKLADQANIMHTTFEDDNEGVYGTPDKILSAVALGPVTKADLVGITDYLPLWTDGL